MGIPQVVIVGRPNVGKSSVFNWLAGKRLAIVDPTSGVTRDRVTHLVDMHGRFAELVDTGGMGVKDADNLTDLIEDQIQTAIDLAHVVLFVVDCRDGPVALDQEIAKRLRYIKASVILVVNKVDTPSLDDQAGEFYRFGRKIINVSAKENRGKAELLDAIHQRLPEPGLDNEPPGDPVMKLAIVGRRNVGKSTLVNTLSQAERMIVSEVPGTTRDSVDVRFELDGKAFMAIDTPGFRRGKSIHTDVELFITGQTGKNAKAMLNHSQMLFRQSLYRVSTSQLNKLLRAVLIDNPPPAFQNRRPKIYYATQVAVQPPTVVLFCNDPKSVSPQYQRFLLRVFRDELRFGEVPIKLYLRRRDHTDQRDDINV